MPNISKKLYRHVAELFPICRSITGEGLRTTLRYISQHIPLDITEVPTGTRVLDWEIPPEWNVRSASLKTLCGRTIVDFSQNNLHLMNYSMPFDGIISRAELEEHLHSLPEEPELIPYVTSYYKRDWGICLAHRERLSLSDEAYRVTIDTDLAPGSLSYGECLLPGECDSEVLISAHTCHPSLANDNLSSIAVAIELARLMMVRKRRYTWRFLFAPGTIGAIAWLSANSNILMHVRHGLVLTCLGDPGPLTYKLSRRQHTSIDRYVAYVLTELGYSGHIIPFSPLGYDERQFCSPGFNLPIGCLMRSPGGTFREYHTSADNLTFIKPTALANSLSALTRIADLIEDDDMMVRRMPFGEPQLSRHGLGDAPNRDALSWVLNLSDGKHTLFDIAEQSHIPFTAITEASKQLLMKDLIVRCHAETEHGAG